MTKKTNLGKSEQIAIVLSSFFMAFVALFYLLAKIDIVPDGAGLIGYIDDLIVLILFVFFGLRLINRIKGRFKRNREAYIKMWKSGDVFKLFTKGRTWAILIILAAAFSYFFWAWDLVPDRTIAIGYVDDAIVAIGLIVTLLRFYAKGRK